MANVTVPVYEELLEFLADATVGEKVLAFVPSPSIRARVDDLLERNRTAGLSEAESRELDEYERLEHLIRLLKARILEKRSV